MTPQQKAELPAGPPEGAPSAWPRASQEWNKKMKPIVQRRRSTSSAISKALSKSKYHLSREILSPTSPPDNGFLSGAFAKPDTAFILDERVQLTLELQTQERHLLLFSNLLVVAKSKSSSSLKLKKQVPLNEVWTGSCLSEVSEKKLNPETSFVIGWPTTNYVVTFSSPEVKERWLSTLLWHIGEMKERESPKSLSMQITLVDGENTPSNTVVAVSNMETADGVIKMATQQLGLHGRPSDYHLWVISGRDQPAYPLIGHEHPFSIFLSCLRDSADQLQGASDNTLLVDEYEVSVLEQLPRDRQCQFILKPRPHAPVKLRRDIFQKHTRRKKSLIDWALRRSTSTPTGSPASQSPTNPRKLFGLSLTSVCSDGSLPKPIMDILQLLYLEGPSTRGIFRRSANAKTCKELKEKLNSGDDVQVDGESVFVAAAVITDFLRNIPDSVLSSDMHGLWMEAMDKENQAHKIDAVKRLVNQLPEANRLLLRHLFGVLHHIQQNAIENQMNAFNLALCIAPNMLWLPSPTGPEEESKSTKKVAMLVQFLIENSAEVFGGDVALLFQRPEKKKSKSVDDLLVQCNDSSDDMEYATSYQERAGKHYGLDPEDVLFGPSAELLLNEDREDWDLFSEITACYQSKKGKNASTDSYDLLEGEDGSFCSAGSLCSLSPARDRCSSEPSVCLSSQLLPPDHEPVARQSSCDATIMRSHGDYIRRLKELQLESQKLLDEGLSPSLGRARRSFWRSPQSSHGAKKPGPQRVSLSNRSSFSSLSSPATSPSASSLSSLDSAFSYCSETSAFSPTDIPSLSFMFGTSARLQALSPKVAKRSLKEWHKPLVSPLPLSPCHVDFCVEEQAVGQEGNSCSQVERRVFVPISVPGSPPKEVNWDEGKVESWHTETLPQSLGISGSIQPGSTAHSPGGERSPLVSQTAQREKSVKHIEIKSSNTAPHSQEGLKRTKITVYMAPKERSLCASPVGQEEQDMATTNQSLSSGALCQRLPRSPQATRVHIPQTVFYGQNTPLVLQSTSRRYHHESVSRTSEVSIPRSPLLAKESKRASQQEEHPLEGQGSGSMFSHTFRVFLPATVRDTIQGYFSQDVSKEHSVAGVETVEKELLRNRVEWLRNQSCPLGASAEDHQSLMFAEETFV